MPSPAELTEFQAYLLGEVERCRLGKHVYIKGRQYAGIKELVALGLVRTFSCDWGPLWTMAHLTDKGREWSLRGLQSSEEKST